MEGPWSGGGAGVRYEQMEISQLAEFALAEGRDRLETSLQPARVSRSAITGLAQVLAELADCLSAVSTPGARLGLTGSFGDEGYLVSIIPHGPGISTDATGLLNRLLQDQDLAFRFASLARLANRLGIDVEFLPAAAGSAARVTIPGQLVVKPGRLEAETESPVDLTVPEAAPAEIPAPSQWAWKSSEAFLQQVFGSLLPRSNRGGDPAPNNVTLLRIRVPGESYALDEDDSPSTASAEAAVDIRSALSTFDEGRRSAKLAADGS